MIRRIIHIEEEKCNGCGACAAACHEGAIEMSNGKARLAKENYCDGLGDCLPACPTGAISFEEREAPAYDQAAVKAAQEKKASLGCPGSRSQSILQDKDETASPVKSQLAQWPVQIKLAPIRSPYFEGADLLIAANCTAYAYGNFHSDFIHGRVTLIGCPKLDQVDYSEKLAGIIASNDIKSVTVARMEVPCCKGMENAVKRALLASGKELPMNVCVISTSGNRIN